MRIAGKSVRLRPGEAITISMTLPKRLRDLLAGGTATPMRVVAINRRPPLRDRETVLHFRLAH